MGFNKELFTEMKRRRIRNKKLCKMYPWLTPRSWDGKICWDEKYEWTEWDALSNGWRKAFGDLFLKDLDDVLRKKNLVNKLHIVELKEKFGSLRLYSNIYDHDVENVIDAYSHISEFVCCDCGKLDSPNISIFGWYAPLCKECYNKYYYNKGRTRLSYEELLADHKIYSPEQIKLPEEYIIMSFSQGKDIREVHDISSYVQKIRYKNRKRKSNLDDIDWSALNEQKDS